MSPQPGLDTNGLVDLLDGLLDTGVAVGGDVTLGVEDVDLVHLQLRALLASVEAERRLDAGIREAARHARVHVGVDVS